MQVVQSRCYEAATAYWRRIKTDPDAETMGVLYWQLNDIWQVRHGIFLSRKPPCILWGFPLECKSHHKDTCIASEASCYHANVVHRCMALKTVL